ARGRIDRMSRFSRCRTNWPTTAAPGQTRSFGDVGSMSGLPKSGRDWRFMSTRPSLTPLADLGRSAGQAPLHCLHAAGIATAGDDAEVAAGLPECLLIDVGLSGRLLDDARRLGATCELLAQEMQRALAALGWLREDRGRGFA